MTKRASLAMLWAVVASAVAMCPAEWAQAQGGNRLPASQAFYTGGSAPMAPAFGPNAELIDAHGDRAVLPAQYCDSCPPGYGGGYGGGYGDPCGGCYPTDQCGMHYFDVSFEFLSLQRDTVFKNTVGFTALNFADFGDPPNLVLSSDAIDPGNSAGFRVTGRYDIGPLSVLEFTYSALNDMSSGASYTDSGALDNGLGNLFSPFTNFGSGFPDATDPNTIRLQGGFDPDDLEDFEETDRSTTHRIAFNSDLQTAEMSFRRYWVGANPRVSGTFLSGFRYTKLKEGFLWGTSGANFLSTDTDPNDPSGGLSSAEYRINADNNLAGFQLGGDAWICVVQGLRVGAEGKCGIYNNHYELTSTFATTDGEPAFSETARDDQVAFISEGKLSMVADVWPSLSIRCGYEVLFLNSLAIVGDNFNSTSPYDNPHTPARVAFVADQGNAVFHGWNCGLEYIW